MLRNNARVHVFARRTSLVAAFPFDIAGVDCDNGAENELLHADENGCVTVQEEVLREQYAKLNLVELTRDIVRYQGMLITTVELKTEVLVAEVEDAKIRRVETQVGGVKLRSA